MRKFLIALVLTISALVLNSVQDLSVFWTGNASAQTIPATYSYQRSSTNFYTNNSLIYIFSDLDADTQYTFTLQRLDDLGNVVQIMAVRTVGGSTSGTITFGSEIWPCTPTLPGNCDTYYAAPLRVIDNFGQILGYHFVAEQPSSDWSQDTANTDENDKQGIGNVVYENENADGWHHSTDANTVLTQTGRYTLLHYRADNSLYPAAQDEYINLYSLPDQEIRAVFAIDELIDYNINESALPDIVLAANSFVVLNTAGTLLPFIDADADFDAFSGFFDNPHRMELTTGAYSYARFDGLNALVSSGESLLLVGNSNEDEWTIQAPDAVQVDTPYVVELRQKTSGIFTSLPEQMLFDSEDGTIDDTDYAFAQSRIASFEPATTGDSTLSWIWNAVDLTEISVAVQDFTFIATKNYSVTVEPVIPDLNGRIDQLMDEYGLNNPFGNLIALFALWLIGFALIWFFADWMKRETPEWIQVLWFLFVGGAWIVLGRSHPITTIVFGAIAIAVVFTIIKSNRSSQGV